jgi:Putative beta-barrel porin-2, OmpL-like. bbp2
MKYSRCRILLFLTLASSCLLADDTRMLDRVVPDSVFLETSAPQIVLSGYVDAGYIYNFTGTSNLNTTGYSTDANASGDFSLNALKLVLEKPLSDENEFQAGFRADVMLGEDAGSFIGVGGARNSDSLYLQQAHVVLRLPFGNGIDLQLGKINSILGFEADERPANFNITQGVNAIPDPGPAPGVLASYPVNDRLTILGGINNGHGADSNAGLDTDSDGYAFVAGVGLTNEAGNAETQIAGHLAPWGDGGPGQTENENILGINWWGTWAPQVAQGKLLLACNTTFWTAHDFSAPASAGAVDDSTNLYVLAAYAKYQFNELFTLASRAEYFHSDDNQFLALPVRPASLGNDIYTWTLTAGFPLSEELLFRTEYRADLGSDVISNTDATLSGNAAHSLSAQVVYSF